MVSPADKVNDVNKIIDANVMNFRYRIIYLSIKTVGEMKTE